MVKVVAVDAPEKKERKRFGFLRGQITVPRVERLSRRSERRRLP